MVNLGKALPCLIGLISLPVIASKGGCTSSLQQKGYINGTTYAAEPLLNVNSMAECVDKCTMDPVCEGVLWASEEFHGLTIPRGPMVHLPAKSCSFMTTAPLNGTVVPTVSVDDGGTTYSFVNVYYCIMDYTSQCSPDICKNGAQCVKDPNGGAIPKCSCSEAGPWYSGQICQTIDNTGPILHYKLRKSNVDVTVDSGKVFPLDSAGDTWSCAFSCYKSEICMGILFRGSTGECMGVRSKPAEPEFTPGHYKYYDRSNKEGGTGSVICNYEESVQYDFRAGPFLNQTEGITSKENCCALCKKTENCSAFSWHPYETKSGQSSPYAEICRLLSQKTDFWDDEYVISGYLT